MRPDNHREGPVAVKEPPVRKRFLDEVLATPGGETIRSCLQCGMCSASCPFVPWMDRTPRMMILLTKANRREAVLRSKPKTSAVYIGAATGFSVFPLDSNRLEYMALRGLKTAWQ